MTKRFFSKTLSVSAGMTLVEVMVGVAILGVIFSVAPKVLMDTYRFFSLTIARAEIQRDARSTLDLINRRLRQGVASTVVVDRVSNSQPYYSRLSFTTKGGTDLKFWQNGKNLMMQEGTRPARLVAKNLRYLVFAYTETDNDAIMSVSVTFERAIYSGKSKALQMAVEKVRIMNS